MEAPIQISTQSLTIYVLRVASRHRGAVVLAHIPPRGIWDMWTTSGGANPAAYYIHYKMRECEIERSSNCVE